MSLNSSTVDSNTAYSSRRYLCRRWRGQFDATPATWTPTPPRIGDGGGIYASDGARLGRQQHGFLQHRQELRRRHLLQRGDRHGQRRGQVNSSHVSHWPPAAASTPTAAISSSATATVPITAPRPTTAAASSPTAGATISASDVSNNQSTRDSGGGIYAAEGITLYNSTVNRNTSCDSGGGIYVSSEHAVITRSTLSLNKTTSSGGAIYVDGGGIELMSSTVSSNSAHQQRQQHLQQRQRGHRDRQHPDRQQGGH